MFMTSTPNTWGMPLMNVCFCCLANLFIFTGMLISYWKASSMSLASYPVQFVRLLPVSSGVGRLPHEPKLAVAFTCLPRIL
jgi:hypothetical protein